MLEWISLYIFIYMSSSDEAFWVPVGPCVMRKRKAGSVTGERLSELHLSTCYKQALASMLQLTIRTTPFPYLVNTQSAATVRCMRQGLASLGPTLGWLCDKPGLGLD